MRRGILLTIVTSLFLILASSCGDDGGISGPEPLPPGIRYDQVTWLTSHNAFAYFDWSEEMPDNGLCVNQLSSIRDQLDNGVRAFQLDIHLWDGNDPAADPVVYLCHGSAELPVPACAQLRFTPLQDELEVIAGFMAENPDEIVTILFEDYVQDEQLLLAPFQNTQIPGTSMSLADVVFNPEGSKWNVERRTAWPPVQWLIDNQQTLVILADGDYEFFGPGGPYMRGNSWSSIEMGDDDCHLKGDASAYAGKMFLMYHLSGPKLMNGWDCPSLSTVWAPSEINTAEFILERYEESCGPALGRPPVFLSLDFVDGCPAGESLCDPTAVRYQGPLEAVRYFNEEVWPDIHGQ